MTDRPIDRAPTPGDDERVKSALRRAIGDWWGRNQRKAIAVAVTAIVSGSGILVAWGMRTANEAHALQELRDKVEDVAARVSKASQQASEHRDEATVWWLDATLSHARIDGDIIRLQEQDAHARSQLQQHTALLMSYDSDLRTLTGELREFIGEGRATMKALTGEIRRLRRERRRR